MSNQPSIPPEQVEPKSRLMSDEACIGAVQRSEQLEAENAYLREALAARDAFLAVAAHELRNPMTPIVGRVQLLRKLMSKADFRPDMLETSLAQIEWLIAQYLKRATTLLDVSRISSGKFRLELSRINVSEIVREVVQNFTPIAEHAGSLLTVVVPEEEVIRIGDRLALEQIVDNLVSNAIKYGAGRPVFVDLSVTTERDVVVKVLDHGMGISPESQARIFERFERAVDAGEHRGGFGVGLWIVRQLAEAMGGAITVASVPSEGSEFRATLPMRIDEVPRDIDENAFARLATGIVGLDTILGGGVMRGGIYIIQGAPGVGKTILTNQICFHHLASSETGCALYVTLLAENHARMLRNLRSLTFFDESRIPDRLTFLSGFSEMRQGGLAALADLVRREIQRRRCSLLVLDGLVSAQASAATPQDFREFVHDLQETALATDCTMFLTTTLGTRERSPEQTMVEGVIELNDRAYGWRSESDLQVRKFRGSGFLRGRHAYKITNAGISVHPRIEALLARPSLADETVLSRTTTGIRKLDKLLGGGLPSSSTTMVMGPSGAGKTTIGLHFLAKASTTEPGLFFGFYETPARIRAKAEDICKPLASLIDSGVVEILWQPPTDDLLDAYGERLLEAIHRRNVRRLFIDGLNGFKKAAVEPGRMDHFFTALANELRVLGVTTLYTLEVPNILGPAIRAPLDDISSIAENMVLLRFIEQRSRLYRLISILKVRDSQFDPTLHQFQITGAGVMIEEIAESAEIIMSRIAASTVEVDPAAPSSEPRKPGA